MLLAVRELLKVDALAVGALEDEFFTFQIYEAGVEVKAGEGVGKFLNLGFYDSLGREVSCLKNLIMKVLQGYAFHFVLIG